MKKWAKIFKLPKHDVLMMHMTNDEEGEHIVLILRVEKGQYIKTVSFDEDIQGAKDFFDKYKKEHAQQFVKEFEKKIKEDV